MLICLFYAFIYYRLSGIFAKQLSDNPTSYGQIKKTKVQLVLLFLLICQRYFIEILSAVFSPANDKKVPNIMTSEIPYTAVNCISISLYFIAYSMTLYLIVRTHQPTSANSQDGEMGPEGQYSSIKSRETKSDVLDSLFQDDEDEDENNANRGNYTTGFAM